MRALLVSFFLLCFWGVIIEGSNREWKVVHGSIQQSTLCPVDIYISDIQRTLQKTGFHRLVSTNLVINPSISNVYDQIILAENLSEDFFVDEYEVTENFKFGGGSKVILNNTIDLEKPAYVSTSNLIYILSNFSKSDVQFEMPIHCRYQSPTTATFVKRQIIPPSIYLYDSRTQQSCKLQLSDVNNLEISIPVGNINQEPFVTALTILFTSLSAFIVLIPLLFGKSKA